MPHASLTLRRRTAVAVAVGLGVRGPGLPPAPTTATTTRPTTTATTTTLPAYSGECDPTTTWACNEIEAGIEAGYLPEGFNPRDDADTQDPLLIVEDYGNENPSFDERAALLALQNAGTHTDRGEMFNAISAGLGIPYNPEDGGDAADELGDLGIVWGHDGDPTDNPHDDADPDSTLSNAALAALLDRIEDYAGPGGAEFLVVSQSPVWPVADPGARWETGNEDDGCLWAAAHVETHLSQMLPWHSGHRRVIENAGTFGEYLRRWDNLTPVQQAQAIQHHRNGDQNVRCPLETATVSEDSYDQCRWELPESGVWSWQTRACFEADAGHAVYRDCATLSQGIEWFLGITDYTSGITVWADPGDTAGLRPRHPARVG